MDPRAVEADGVGNGVGTGKLFQMDPRAVEASHSKTYASSTRSFQMDPRAVEALTVKVSNDRARVVSDGPSCG